MGFDGKLIDELLAGRSTVAEIADENGLLKQLTKATVQLCIVHMVRGSSSYVGWKERKAVAADLKDIYRAATAEEAERQLEEFAAKWDHRYPSISAIRPTRLRA
jgi:transposase-like protein